MRAYVVTERENCPSDYPSSRCKKHPELPFSWTLTYQLLHLFQVRFEQGQGLAHRFWRGHIYPSLLEQLDAVVRGTWAEKLQVAVNRGLAFVQYLLHQGRGGADTRRILVDIEAGVEVRNTRPLDVDQVIDRRLCAVVLLVESAVRGAERIGSQRLALLGEAVYALLELCEHSLPEQCAPELFQ